ncbi:MAG: hypothetical protein H7281_15120 [Bacteriovorax sp.]|nr:hypothetical protein [Bacteriovorax sp.]
MNTFRSYMIIEYPTLKNVSDIISKDIDGLIVIFLLLSILFEYFGEMNFIRVIKRVFICFLILGSFKTLFVSSLDLSFGFSNNIIKLCKNTEFCDHYLKVTKGKNADSGFWDETVELFTNFSSYLPYVAISLIFKICFIFTRQLYSLVNALLWILYPLICAIGILQHPGEKSFVSLFQSLLWLFISPIILSIIIVLLAKGNEVGIGPKGEIGLAGVLHFLIISLFSLASLYLSWKIVTGEGVAAFGSQMAMMGTTVMAMSALNNSTILGKGYAQTAGHFGSSGPGLLKNSFKESLSKNSSKILSSKGLKLGPDDIGKTKTGFMNSTLAPKGSEAFKSMNAKEKIVTKLDSIFNAKENTNSKLGMVRDLKKMSSSEVSKNSISNPLSYKDAVRKTNNPINRIQKPEIGNYLKTAKVPSLVRNPNFVKDMNTTKFRGNSKFSTNNLKNNTHSNNFPTRNV